MRIQAYTAFSGVLTLTCSTVRPLEAASTHFTAASAHNDWSALVDGIMEEHKHILPTSAAFPISQQFGNYFPTHSGTPLYAVKQIMPAGFTRGIDKDFMLEISAMRYEYRIDLLRAAFAVDATTRRGIQRAMEYAAKQLLVSNGVPLVFVFGDNGLRPANPDTDVGISEVDVVCELGAALNRTGIDIPDPNTDPTPLS